MIVTPASIAEATLRSFVEANGGTWKPEPHHGGVIEVGEALAFLEWYPMFLDELQHEDLERLRTKFDSHHLESVAVTYSWSGPSFDHGERLVRRLLSEWGGEIVSG